MFLHKVSEHFVKFHILLRNKYNPTVKYSETPVVLYKLNCFKRQKIVKILIHHGI